jgi:hypothetical protein
LFNSDFTFSYDFIHHEVRRFAGESTSLLKI